MNSKPAWSMQWVPGQLRLCSETLCQKQKEDKEEEEEKEKKELKEKEEEENKEEREEEEGTAQLIKRLLYMFGFAQIALV